MLVGLLFCVVVLINVLLQSTFTKPVPIEENNQLKALNSQRIDDIVSKAILKQAKSYELGETATEGHIILDSKESGELLSLYTIASYGAFGFENDIFTKISGSGAIPTVMVFEKYDNGEYVLKEYKEPMDGEGYADSIKKMFPKELWDKVFATDKYSELSIQQENQAKKYLEKIGRVAKVSADTIERKLSNINVEASNKLFSELTKNDNFLNHCPYWLGTKEFIENGNRYRYETSQSKTNDGFDLITFIKSKEDGTVVEKRKYIICLKNKL